MAEVEDILKRVNEALSEGKVWRAKEILRGNIGARGYSPRIYERYGNLLLNLGERMEAGKYLFLSGERKEEYEDAISLFLDRYRNTTARDLVRSFPRGARLRKRSQYPDPVGTELKKLSVGRRLPTVQSGSYERPGGSSKLGVVGCWIVVFTVFILALIGLLTVVSWLTA